MRALTLALQVSPGRSPRAGPVSTWPRSHSKPGEAAGEHQDVADPAELRSAAEPSAAAAQKSARPPAISTSAKGAHPALFLGVDHEGFDDPPHADREWYPDAGQPAAKQSRAQGGEDIKRVDQRQQRGRRPSKPGRTSKGG